MYNERINRIYNKINLTISTPNFSYLNKDFYNFVLENFKNFVVLANQDRVIKVFLNKLNNDIYFKNLKFKEILYITNSSNYGIAQILKTTDCLLKKIENVVL